MLLRVKGEFAADNVTLVAAGVAFYILLSLFPLLAALVFVYGIAADRAQVEQQVSFLSDFLPQNAVDILRTQLHDLAQGDQATMSVAAIAGFLLALWSATKGTSALVTALDIAYEERTRGFIRQNAISLLFTFGGVLLGVVALGLVAVVPVVLGFVGLGDAASTLLTVLRWPFLAILFLGALAVLYRYGPNRSEARWRWVTWGSAAATLMWIGASLGFSLYVEHFGSYNETYGALGAVVVLMMWLWLSVVAVLTGAELNAEIEHQTARDTTTGPEEPLGRRGAYVADHVGRSPSDQ